MPQARADRRRSRAGRGAWLWMLVAVLASPQPSAAHDFTLTESVLTLRADGRFVLDLICDLDALALGLPSGSGSQGHEGRELAQQIAALSNEERTSLEGRLRRLFERRVRLRVNGEPILQRVAFPERPTVGIEPDAESFFGVTARLHGMLAQDATSITMAASRSFRAVHLTVLQQAGPVERQVLGPGEESEPIALTVRRADEPVVLTDLGVDSDSGSSTGSTLATLRDYIGLGFVHIIPRGLDHIAFIAALVLLTRGVGALALLVTSFTLGHTVSLALASRDLVRASPALIEPLIALSIGWAAVVALMRLRAQRGSGRAPDSSRERIAEGAAGLGSGLWAVGLIGLLHGFGFASVLGSLGLPSGAWLAGLLGFNLGVELGQLVVLGVALVMFWLLTRVFSRERVAAVASFVLLGASLYFVAGVLAG